MSAARSVLARSTLARSLCWVVVAGVVIVIASNLLSAYNNLQLATGLYYFAALAGLTVLAGQSGQISLGHGAFMAVGAYTVALLIGNQGWALVPAIAAAVAVSILVGIPVGAAASRLRGPYLAGATLAFAVGLPALADRFPTLLGGENGLTINPPVPPSWLGADFPLEQWEALIAGAGALVVLFVLYNVIGSGVGRSMRAVRDDEIAASLCGLSVGRTQTIAFIVSAGCAGLGGAILAVVLQLADRAPSRCSSRWRCSPGVVLGGLGSLVGAMWGAALLTLLPNWTNDIAHSFSLSTKVSANLPLAIYGIVLIVAMILWPSGIQGGIRAALGRARAVRNPASAGRPTGASTPGSA